VGEPSAVDRPGPRRSGGSRQSGPTACAISGAPTKPCRPMGDALALDPANLKRVSTIARSCSPGSAGSTRPWPITTGLWRTTGGSPCCTINAPLILRLLGASRRGVGRPAPKPSVSIPDMAMARPQPRHGAERARARRGGDRRLRGLPRRAARAGPKPCSTAETAQLMLGDYERGLGAFMRRAWACAEKSDKVAPEGRLPATLVGRRGVR